MSGPQPQPLSPKGKRKFPRGSGSNRFAAPNGRRLTGERDLQERNNSKPKGDDKSRFLAKLAEEKAKNHRINENKTPEERFKMLKGIYQIPKPMQVQQYSSIYAKLRCCFLELENLPLDNLVLKSRYAVYISHVAINMANILSHNLEIYQHFDPSIEIKSFANRKKRKLMPNILSTILQLMDDIDCEDVKNYFQDRTEGMVLGFVLSCMQELTDHFISLAKHAANYANEFYGSSGIFTISADLEEKFRFLNPSVMRSHFTSFKGSIGAVVKYRKLAIAIVNNQKPGYAVSTEKLMLHLNRSGMSFLNTITLSNVKLFHSKMLIEHRVIVPQYCNIIGRYVQGLTNTDILTHIECRILDNIER